MFSILACCPSLLNGKAPPSDYGFDRYRGNKETLVVLDDQTTPAQLLFFKTEPPPVSTVASDPSISLDDLDAVFIHSGPFQFRNTDRVDEHLSLDGQNHILIYFDIWKGDQPGRQLGPPYGLQTNPPQPGQESVGSTTLAVTNLPYRIRWQDLKDLFRRYGTPSRADVFLAPDGRSRGVGMVSMRTRREAENCVNDLNGYEWFGRKIGVKIDETGGHHALAAAAMAGATIWEGVSFSQTDYEVNPLSAIRRVCLEGKYPRDYASAVTLLALLGGPARVIVGRGALWLEQPPYPTSNFPWPLTNLW